MPKACTEWQPSGATKIEADLLETAHNNQCELSDAEVLTIAAR
jgi:hypothetical protein